MRPQLGRLVFGMLLACAMPALAQSFDAASVKPADPGAVGSTFQFPPGGRLRIANGTLRQIIETAWYEFRDFQIVGGPSWLNSERYDISATSESGASDSIPQVRKKLQTLLAERFQLQVHNETREVPIYKLVPVRNGIGIESANPADQSGPAGIRSSCGQMIGTKATMADLTVYLSRQFHRPVEDQSGLNGKYNFRIEWTPDDVPCSPPTEGPSIFTALQEKLGLRLESARSPREVLVIDSAKRAGEN